MKKFNIALTFDKDISQGIIDYSRELYKILDSDVILGENSTPHMTIGQFSVDDATASKVWGNYKSMAKELPKINLAGLTILPSRSAGAWIEISVLKSKELLKLQEDLINILLPFGTLTNDTGDNYRPHITVAHTITGTEFMKFPFEYKTLRLKSVATELGIGLGTNFENLTL